MNQNEVDELEIKRTDTKRATETDLIRSDRVELVEQANRLVETMVAKEILPKAMSGVASGVELTAVEQKAYDSALTYLTRQFERGHSDSQTYTSKVETNKTVERFDPPKKGLDDDTTE